jgi:fructokinase
VAFLDAVSGDVFGMRLRAALEADGVSVQCLVPTPKPTTLALVQTDAAGVAAYQFYIEGTAAPAVEPGAALAVLPARLDAVCVGSFGLVLEPLADAVAAVLEADAVRSALVVLDPNVRASLVADRAMFDARLQFALERCHVLKASVEDLAWLAPGEAPADAARRLLGFGARVALITCGPEGALVVGPSGELAVPAPAVSVADTIGAGDAFTAGFVAWWRECGRGVGELGDLEAVGEAARFACLVAGRTCERPGAEPPRMAPASAEAGAVQPWG